MQVKASILVLFAVTAVCAQSKDDLKKKYGEPVAETFLIRPGITVTAFYDSRGKVTELIIAPQVVGLIKTRNQGLSPATASSLVDELIPIADRGKPGFAGFFNIGCLPQNDCYGSFTDFEKVTIYYNAGRQNEVAYAVIKWKQ
jgi:hypothetical protein